MRCRSAIAALLILAASGCVAASQAAVIPAGNLVVRFKADYDPHRLPREHPAPVRVEIHGSVSTTDGSHPPTLRTLEVELNRNGQLTSTGLPRCTAALLQSTTTDQALNRCGQAIVGRGDFRAVVDLGGDVPASGSIVAFNGRISGKPGLLLHFFARVPVRFTLVVPLAIGHKRRGEFGTVLRTQVPSIAGGLGSITRLDLAIGRRYSFRGRRLSYVSAACDAPAGFGGGVFSFARARFHFANHPEIRATLTDSCWIRGRGEG